MAIDVDINIERLTYASGRVRLHAQFPTGERVTWFTFPGPLVGTDYVDVPRWRFEPHFMHEIRVQRAEWKLVRMASRFWLNRQLVDRSHGGDNDRSNA